MPTPAPLKPLTSWSFSRYSDYKKCPAFFKYKHLMGLKEPGNEAMERGTAIHSLAEQYVGAKGKGGALPAELALFTDEFKRLRSQKVKYVEEQWTWTKDWAAECQWNDWNQAWVRIKLDVAYAVPEHNALVIVDHKTGKPSAYKEAEYDEQLELYGLAGLKKFPDVEVVSPRLWYLDAGVIYPDGEVKPELEFTRKQEQALAKKWSIRIKPMFTDKEFAPTPGRQCSWCHYRKSNNGPCKN